MQGITRPLEALRGGIARLSAGEAVRLDVESDDEIYDLAASFNDMTDKLAVYANEIRRSASENERILTELLVASRIQRMLLPDDSDGREIAGRRLYGRMTPMKEVGGDFFNYFPLGRDSFFFVVADVSGHGVPAALFMMVANFALQSLVRSEPDVARAFSALNNHLCERNSESYFVTAFAGVFDASEGRLQYVDAGHNPPYIKSAMGRFHQLPCDVNLVLGGMPDIEYRSSEAILKKGDVLCVYTDGVTEAMNERGEMYSEERLAETLEGSDDDPQVLVVRALADVRSFAGGAEQSDDMTMLCVKFYPYG
jgi:sigma-B regulation protein RsbU (phosphoserine phosphatase)